jgi:hypothetical protein
VLLTYTSQTGEHQKSDRFLLVKSRNFHRRTLHRPGRCSSPVRPVQARKPQIHQTGLPSSKLTQTQKTATQDNKKLIQTITRGKTHRASTPVRPVSTTGQTGQAGPLGDDQHQRVNSPKSNSRYPESLHRFVQGFGDSRNTSWALHSQYLIYQEQRKPQIRPSLVTDLGGESKGKEPQRIQAYIPHQIPKRKASKSLLENCQEKAPKITKKDKQEQHIQALRNHAESSIHTKEVHTRSSLPLDHPYLSQDHTTKLSS